MQADRHRDICQAGWDAPLQGKGHHSRILHSLHPGGNSLTLPWEMFLI